MSEADRRAGTEEITTEQMVLDAVRRELERSDAYQNKIYNEVYQNINDRSRELQNFRNLLEKLQSELQRSSTDSESVKVMQKTKNGLKWPTAILMFGQFWIFAVALIESFSVLLQGVQIGWSVAFYGFGLAVVMYTYVNSASISSWSKGKPSRSS